MDANGLKFWQLADARHFPATRHVAWDARRRLLRLASERSVAAVLPAVRAFEVAQSALEAIPRAVDRQSGVACWEPGVGNTGKIVVRSDLPGSSQLLNFNENPSDLAVGHDGVFYAVLPGQVRLHDLRGRWTDIGVSAAGFTPWRLAPCVAGGVWVLERVSGRLARLDGYPMPAQTPHPDDYDPKVFRPNPENCRPPRLLPQPDPARASDESVLGLCLLEGDQPLILLRRGGDGLTLVRRWLTAEGKLGPALILEGAAYAYALTSLGGERIAVRVPGRRDAPAYDLAHADADGRVPATGEVYPLARDAEEAPFANGPQHPPHYPVAGGRSQPLYPLSIANLARRGNAASYALEGPTPQAFLIDSGDHTTVWHRLYVEAAIPAQCGFVVWLAASTDAAPPAADDLTAWHPHGFGRDIADLDPAMTAPQVPRAAREHHPSELPGHPGLLCPGDGDAGERGLFSVLIQNSRQRSRSLTGRYLWLRLTLWGDGRVSPEIAALRVWSGRFSYADHYLPRLYRENLFGAAAAAPGEEVGRIARTHAAALDAGHPLAEAVVTALGQQGMTNGCAVEIRTEAAGHAWLLLDQTQAWRLRREGDDIVVYRPRATPADFTARMLGNFEGFLTQLEDRVAAAHLYSCPATVPQASLEWLGAWIGVAFDPALPAQYRRDWLAAAPELARCHGTRHGLRLALDIASGGGVRGGEIVVIEDFRLRRILATLLGVDLADESDPLLPGLAVSGNSVVGDTLFLGDHARAELLALYRSEVATAAEQAQVQEFHARLAHRATVLVHQEVESQDLALLRRIVRLAAPAHVDTRVISATWPLLVGVSSLVGVDTYLGPPRPPRPVRVQRSALGQGDFLLGEALLDARLAGAVPAAVVPAPTADAGPDRSVEYGKSFALNGSASRAAAGHSISEYRWRLLPSQEN